LWKYRSGPVSLTLSVEWGTGEGREGAEVLRFVWWRARKKKEGEEKLASSAGATGTPMVSRIEHEEREGGGGKERERMSQWIVNPAGVGRGRRWCSVSSWRPLTSFCCWCWDGDLYSRPSQFSRVPQEKKKKGGKRTMKSQRLGDSLGQANVKFHSRGGERRKGSRGASFFFLALIALQLRGKRRGERGVELDALAKQAICVDLCPKSKRWGKKKRARANCAYASFLRQGKKEKRGKGNLGTA